MDKIKSLKMEITGRVGRFILCLQDWLSYNLKKAFMTLSIIFAVEIFLFSLRYYELSTAVSVVTLLFVLLTFLDISQFLEKRQIPKKLIDVVAVGFLDDNTLTVNFKNISQSFSGYPEVRYIILKKRTAVLDYTFCLRNLSPAETHRILIDISKLDNDTEYSLHVIINKYTHKRVFKKGHSLSEENMPD